MSISALIRPTKGDSTETTNESGLAIPYVQCGCVDYTSKDRWQYEDRPSTTAIDEQMLTARIRCYEPTAAEPAIRFRMHARNSCMSCWSSATPTDRSGRKDWPPFPMRFSACRRNFRCGHVSNLAHTLGDTFRTTLPTLVPPYCRRKLCLESSLWHTPRG